LTNCTFTGNSCGAAGATNLPAWAGGGGFCVGSGGGLEGVRTSFLRNCIFWGNTVAGSSGSVPAGGPTLAMNGVAPGQMSVAHCDVEGGQSAVYLYSGPAEDDPVLDWGAGNINANPLFVSAANFRLQAGSLCINAGDNELVPEDFADLDQDSSTVITPFDLDKLARFCAQQRVDMGAYEHHGAADCPDLNGDENVNVTDLLALISDWGECELPPPADCPPDVAGCDGNVNVTDLLSLITNWGPCEGPPESFPITSFADCQTMCAEAENWSNCMQKCIQYLCEMELINCEN